MIRLDNVNKYFNRKKSNEIHVINNTSLEMGDTGLVALLGSSGCGKTTLLNAIGGLDKINSGNIYVNGKDISRCSSSKKDDIRNANIGYIFQNYNLIEDMSVFDNVAIALRMIGVRDKDEIERRVMYILAKVGLDRYKSRPARMLSGGERQRVGIARAIVKNPKIIIADEPTGNLDSRNTIEIMNIIKAISRERLVILVTHERDIAHFYASRIISIVDGRVVSDEENSDAENLEYRPDNRIYLRDLPDIQELNGDGVNIQYFSDNSVRLDDLKIKVVIKNGSIYVEAPDGVADGFDGVELVDDNYRALSKDVYEEYTLDENEMVSKDYRAKYTSIFGPISMIKSGWRKVSSYSIIKKILLVGFLLAAMISTYAVSSMVGMLDIEDKEFVTTNQNYVTVKTGKLDMDRYNDIKKIDGVSYVIAGDANISLNFPIDDYYQTFGQSTSLEGCLTSEKFLEKDKIVAGKMPSEKNEIAVDQIAADNMFQMEQSKMIGIKEYEDLIGRKVKSGEDEYEIAAVTNQGSPSIYVDNKVMDKILLASQGEDASMDEEASEEGAVTSWDRAKDDKNITITKGTAPAEDYQVLLPADQEEWNFTVGTSMKKKINGHNLVISGFYKDKYDRGLYYVNQKTAKREFVTSKNQVMICTEDKPLMMQTLSEEKLNATDNYEKDRKAYKDSCKNQLIATMVSGFVFLIISLIEMYLMLRSSFLSRIKEVGVLRAIGLKKKDIYRMFSGEIVIISALTAIPGVAVTAYIMSGIAEAPQIGYLYYMSPLLALAIFAVLFIFNLLAGLLPVFRTMRKTPAQILARNDAD